MKRSTSRLFDWYLPAGSMVQAKLLNEVIAPPSTQGPGLPVLLLVRKSFLGPNSSPLRVDDWMLPGAGDKGPPFPLDPESKIENPSKQRKQPDPIPYERRATQHGKQGKIEA